MINKDRFIAQSADRDAWLAAREKGVTATMVANASTPAGFKTELERRLNPVPIEPNAYMEFGNEQEPIIAKWVFENFDIAPNDWLIAHESNDRYMATPDGLANYEEGVLIAEIKTTGKDFNKPPLAHMRQMMWQMYVTGAERCLYVWQLRVPNDAGWFYPGWFEPRHLWIDRDEQMIEELRRTADALLIDWDGWLDTDHEKMEEK